MVYASGKRISVKRMSEVSRDLSKERRSNAFVFQTKI
jgi:hypothetical protein